MGFTLLLFKEEQNKESNDSWFQNIANNQLFIYFMWKSMFLLHEFVRLQCVSVSEQKLSLLPFFSTATFPTSSLFTLFLLLLAANAAES